MKWIRRGFEFGLVGAIAVALYFAAAEGRERARLLADYERIRKTTGDVEFPDPSKFYVLAIPTGEPLRFAWRFHGPKGTSLAVAGFLGGGSSSSTMQTATEDALPTVRLRLSDERGLETHTNFQSTSSTFSSGGQALARLIRGRESEVVVEQLGEPMAAMKPGTQVLLRLRLSDALMKDAETVVPPDELNRLPGGEIFRVEIGYNPPPPAPPAGAPPGPEPSP